MSDELTWQEVVEMWQEYLKPPPPFRFAAVICVAPDIYSSLITENPPTSPSLSMQFAGVGVSAQSHYAPGEWRMFDQFGEELARGSWT